MRNVKITEVRGIGGGSKSLIWSQIKADILGVPYVLLNQEEFAALALAVIGGYAVKAFKDYKKTINEWVKPVKRIEPRMNIHEKYLRYAEFYEKLIAKSDLLFEGHERLVEE